MKHHNTCAVIVCGGAGGRQNQKVEMFRARDAACMKNATYDEERSRYATAERLLYVGHGIANHTSACSSTFAVGSLYEKPSLPSIANARMYRRMLHVSNLDYRVDATWLRSVFQTIGIVEHVAIEQDYRSRELRSKALILFISSPCVELSLIRIRDFRMFGQTLLLQRVNLVPQ